MLTSLTSSGGVVQSPNYPGDYGNYSRTCSVDITVPAGWMIQFNYTTFNVEISKATVYVRKDIEFQCSYDDAV
ncbi:hypothetical protein DAPPUDRAFT_253533 [Daphnia pulex]|uniref:CUB domain-containing protein n=1 Tax=Daphnia pulex TaxID=6669 RepID=E9H528_DAPPU|nr:hypothetical protein DAPPUDRAFT_253533 [Daphnia pulex]|eukprot:EFX73254.1 hypothetical protein DAPPUDRAFT_253533 [Daphnia pulex]